METPIIIAAVLTVAGIGAVAVSLFLLGRALQKRTVSLAAERSFASGTSNPFVAHAAKTRGANSAIRGVNTRPPAALEVFGLSKAEAEVWLDWLENNGHHDCKLSFVEPGSFTVRQGRGT